MTRSFVTNKEPSWPFNEGIKSRYTCIRRASKATNNLLPIRYCPYTILNRIGENAYRLDMPPQMGIHNVINVNNLKLFEPSLLEEVVTITHRVDKIPDFQLPLAKETIPYTRRRSTRHQTYTSYLAARQGQTPDQVK
jgi:hypothetical protein